MENPENLERIQMEQFVPVEIFRKKSNIPSRYLYLFSFLTETTEIFHIIRLDYQGQGSSREKVKNLPLFCQCKVQLFFVFFAKRRATALPIYFRVRQFYRLVCRLGMEEKIKITEDELTDHHLASITHC